MLKITTCLYHTCTELTYFWMILIFGFDTYFRWTLLTAIPKSRYFYIYGFYCHFVVGMFHSFIISIWHNNTNTYRFTTSPVCDDGRYNTIPFHRKPEKYVTYSSQYFLVITETKVHKENPYSGNPNIACLRVWFMVQV